MFYSILYVQKSNDRPSISGLRHASCSQRRTPRRCWNRIDLRPVLSRRVGNAHHAPDVPKSTLSRVANLKTGSCCFHVLKCTFSIPPKAQRNIIFILFVQGKGVHKVIHGWANAKVHAAQGISDSMVSSIVSKVAHMHGSTYADAAKTFHTRYYHTIRTQVCD